ncbi:MAG TPA: glycoside hydrolase family 3 protein [candidate division Zixibacteria bacterium]|nr:glycoside hydrolase family 3 protein [candidate division Zixibacteria bacterium]
MIILIVSGCEKSPAEPDETDDELRFQIAQMLIVGFRGTELDDTNHIIADIAESHIGGVILYEYDVPSGSRPRNIESPSQLSALVSGLQSLDTIPLFVAIDQEGGFVNRLRESYGFPQSVSAQYLGEVDDADTTRYWGSLCAATLEDMGINLNFAPVVDLNINPDCPAIGRWERSFSADPNVVTTHASIIIEEHRNRGIFTAVKHFPGHGSSEDDTHWGMADVTETWSEAELEPFARLIEDGYNGMIMTAHISNGNLDALFPATLSHSIMTGILRDSLGWDGIIVPDDMMMGAIEEYFGMAEALELAINAGVDLLIFSNNSPVYNANIASNAIAIIETLVEDGRIPRSRIEEAYSRISAMKSGMR